MIFSKAIHLFLGIVFLGTCSVGVIGQAMDREEANSILNEIVILNNSGEFKMGLDKLEILEEQFESNQNWQLHYDIYLLKYKLFSNRRKNKSARKAAQKAEKIWNANNGEENAQLLTTLATAYIFNGKTEKYLETAELAWEAVLSENPVDSLALATLHRAEGHYYQRVIQNVDKAIEAYSEALNIQMALTKPETATLGRTLRNLGNLGRVRADYEQSLIFYQQEADLYLNHYSADHFDIAVARYNMANVHYELINFEQALDLYMKTLPVWEKNPPSKRFMRYLYEAIGDMNWELGNQEKALEFFDKSVLIEEKGTDAGILSDVEKGISLANKGAHDEALKYYQKALSYREENFGRKHPMTGACHNFIAYTLKAKNQAVQALQAYHNSLIMLVEEFSDSNIYSNPSLEMSFGWENYYLDALAAKGELLAQKFEISKQALDLEVAFETYWLAIQVIDRIRQRPITESSKLFWTKKAFPIYEAAIGVALQLDDLKSEAGYAKKAFEVTEKSKAFLLRAALQESDAAQFSNLPEDLKKKEQDLKSAINDYQGKINREELRCAEAKIKMLKVWRNKLLSLQTEYDGFLNKLKEDYPQYYDLKYQIETANVNSIQKQLFQNQDGALIEFFEGEKHLYIFVITKDYYKTWQLNIDSSYFQTIQNFRNTLVNYENSILTPDSAYQQFINSGVELFQKLLEKPLQNLPKTVDKLYLIPDGHLAYLPFECFLIQSPENKKRNYRTLPYLFQKYAISYAQSASFLQNVLTETDRTGNNGFLAFAPSYQGSFSAERSAVSQLFHNRKEAEIVANVFDGQVFLENNASEFVFKEKAASANILHLAMHALVEDKHPILSKLVFSETDSTAPEDGFLHTYELYNLKLNANLVMLSACNTGVGQWIRGEGMMSLARGFQYAGCPSIGTSLWTVDDQSTAVLMELFYENLKNKMPKNEAMRQAKIQFLEKADPAVAHPFFWGSFILIGDTEIVEWNAGFGFWVWIGLATIFALGIFWYKKKLT